MRFLALSLALVGSAPALPAEGSLQRDLGSCAAEQSKLAPFNGFISAGVGDARFEQASGFADARGVVPIARNTPFRLASVGKLFGIERAMEGGIGTASIRVGAITVGALVAVIASAAHEGALLQ